jgi:predicted secreted protein
MFRMTRLPLALALAFAGALALGPAAVTPVAASTTMLMDAVGPGVMHGTDGFGTSTVLVPKNGYVTYLVRTDSALKGKTIQIWTDTGKGWKLTTTRAIAADGSVHYFARVTGRIGFWAKLAGASPAVVSHGRSAALSTDGTTTITIGCDDLSPTGSAVKSIVNRTVAVPIDGTVRVVVCSNPSTGFSWSMASLDATHLLRVGHTIQAPKSAAAKAGAPGLETWSVRLKTDGIGRATLIYSQPWRGGEKAAWTLMLAVETS